MRAPIGLFAAFAILISTAQLAAQAPPGQAPQGNIGPQAYPPPVQNYGPQQPAQPIGPQPQAVSAPAAPRQAGPPVNNVQPSPPQPPARFQLTPHQTAELNRALKLWEQSSAQVKTFESDFNRFTYDAAFGNPNKPMFVDSGLLKYSAPDKGMFKVDGPRPEHWICDGKSIFEYSFAKKQLIEHRLPPELQGKAIADGPIPFLFGANAEKLKQRYYLRITTDPARAKEEVWLEAFPRFQQDAANFERADLILKIATMQPFAVRVYEPGGRQHKVYEFKNVLVNQTNLFSFLKGDPFTARLPALDWKRIVEEPPAPAEARRH